jgi:hypothetical protein
MGWLPTSGGTERVQRARRLSFLWTVPRRPLILRAPRSRELFASGIIDAMRLRLATLTSYRFRALETVALSIVVIAAFVAPLGVSLVVGPGVAVAQSPSGVPLPTQAGTTWQVASGYNTSTHVGEDPHALDIVRVDAETSSSELRSPVTGTISYVSGDCLTVRDANRNAHLLCHVFAVPGLSRGMTVQQGDLLARVAGPGYANNNGLAHIHYAVHTSFGGGQIAKTLPFTGQYALEGRNLVDNGLFSQYSGDTFVSTNGSAQPSGGSAEPDPEREEAAELAANATGFIEASLPADIVARVEAEPDFLVPGWNLVGWMSDAPVGLATAAITTDLAGLFTFDSREQRFQSYAPGLPEGLNTIDDLSFGVGVWVLVDSPEGVVWLRPEVERSRSVSMVRGFNLVTWTAARMSIADALRPIEQVVEAVYSWDPVARSFRIFRIDGPTFLNNLNELEPGQAIWVQMQNASVWRQG